MILHQKMKTKMQASYIPWCRVDPSFKKLTWHCVVTEQDRFDFLLCQVFWKQTNWKTKILIDVIFDELWFLFFTHTFPACCLPIRIGSSGQTTEWLFLSKTCKILSTIKPNESQYVKHNYSSNFTTYSTIFSYYWLRTQHGGKINDESRTFVHSIPLNNETKLNPDGCMNHSGNAFNSPAHKQNTK
jgi:hypothetical protein